MAYYLPWLANPPGVTTPELVSASIPAGGTTISLVFSVPIVIGASGNNGGWTLSVNGGASSMTYASGIGGTTLVYNLGRRVLLGETGTISYTQPGNGIEALSGGVDLSSLSGFTISNSSTQRPTLNSATIATSGTTVSLVFSQTVQFGAGGNSGLTLTMSGGTITSPNLTYATGSGSTTLVYNIVGRTIQTGETGSISYTQPGNGIETVAAPNVDVATVSLPSVTNSSTQTAPVLTSSTVQSSGMSINLVFNQAVQFGAGGNSGWTLTMSGGTFSGATLTYASGSGTSTLIYNLGGRVVQYGETGTISYTQPGNGVESSSNLVDLSSVASGSVANSSIQGYVAGSNPIDAARRIDWTTYAGTSTDSSTRTKSGATISAYSGSSATIQSALSAASANQYVELGAGTFNLSSALNIAQKDNITLRGQGPNVTILKFSSTSGSVFPYAGPTPLTIAGSTPYNADATPVLTGAPSAAVSVTGTNGQPSVFSKGATVLNLSSSGSFAVGDSGCFVMDNDPPATLPRVGFFGSSKQDQSGSTANGINWQGTYYDFGAIQHQRFVVTNVSGNNITIFPPLNHGFYLSTRNPRVYRYPQAGYSTGITLENMTIDTTTLGTIYSVLGIIRAKEFKVKNVLFRFSTGKGGDTGITVSDSFRFEFSNNWLEKLAGGGLYTTTSYGISLSSSHFGVIANNIYNEVESPMTINVGSSGNVLAYNYEKYNGTHEGGIDFHEPASFMNLLEGNSILKVSGDLFHGNSMATTAFRNHGFNRGFDLQSYHRFWNLVGNVINASTVYKTRGDTGAYDRWASFGFRLGYNGQNASTNAFYNGAPNIGVSVDIQVSTTAMLWGNYTTVSGNKFDSTEVPAADPTLPNPIPPDNTLPASMYYTARPGYFTIAGVGTQPWPLIGPDVTGGDFLAGKAYKTPAQKMYELAGGLYSAFDPSKYGS
jgi:hypothetical protein